MSVLAVGWAIGCITIMVGCHLSIAIEIVLSVVGVMNIALASFIFYLNWSTPIKGRYWHTIAPDEASSSRDVEKRILRITTPLGIAYEFRNNYDDDTWSVGFATQDDFMQVVLRLP